MDSREELTSQHAMFPLTEMEGTLWGQWRRNDTEVSEAVLALFPWVIYGPADSSL